MKWLSVVAAGALALCSSTIAQGDDGTTVAAYRSYAAAVEAGDSEAAARYAELAYERALEEWGAGNVQTGYLASNYGTLLHGADKWWEASNVFEKCAEILEAHLPGTVLDLANCRLMQGKSQAARPRVRDARNAYDEVIALEPMIADEPLLIGIVGEAYLGVAAIMMPAEAPYIIGDEPDPNYRIMFENANAALPLLEQAYGDRDGRTLMTHKISRLRL